VNHSLIDKPIVRTIFTNRLVLLAVLFAIQLQFFVINLANSMLREPTDGWELKIAFIDDHLVPQGVWLIPYTFGFFAAVLVPVWAAYVMPNRLFRQFVLSMTIAALFGYAIYILFPTYVIKPEPHEVPGNDVLAEMLRSSYEADSAASTHNAAPSQHVFYALLNMCFMIRFRPRPRVLWTWVTLAALISASTLLTQRHNSPDVITGYLVAVGAYYASVRLGAWITARLGDVRGPIVMPPARFGARLRQRVAKMQADSA
jgi:membrane-associated phospholipid phosphatase